MNISESIKNLRKEQDLSQDQFADLFNVTRQTVSNWENGKSYPDLETIIKISDQFSVSVDELLKNDQAVVKKIDSQKKKKDLLLIIIGVIFWAAIISGFFLYNQYEEKNKISFDMSQDKTYQIKEAVNSPLELQTGYFTLPKSGKVNIKAKGETDNGTLQFLLTNAQGKPRYQISGQTVEDDQSVFLDEGAYTIQVTADDYTEKVVSLEYKVEVSNE